MTGRKRKWKRGCLIVALVFMGIICYVAYEIYIRLAEAISRSCALDLAEAYSIQINDMVHNTTGVTWDNFQLDIKPRFYFTSEDGLYSDEWGHPFHVYMTLTEEGDDLLQVIGVLSAGRDGAWGTKDDFEMSRRYLLNKPRDWPERKDAILATGVRLQ